ncbi:hypothetical protein DGWBC_0403 [Dehalogenimonas sp. WBC-2]|nr:hypothetical protein DGWBC_0403 [Dehalogenimonas sp. WBC-2]
MPKKFDDVIQSAWLASFDQGKSTVEISREKKVDHRVVKKAVDRLILERQSRQARLELLKDALLKHNDKLMATLKGLKSTIATVDISKAPLSWQRDRHNPSSIFREREVSLQEIQQIPLIQGTETKEWILLKQHLTNDKLWRLLKAWGKSNQTLHLAAVEAQYDLKEIIENNTGLPMIDKDEPSRPFVYSYTTGDIFYSFALGKPRVSSDEFIQGITIEPHGDIRRGGSILALARGQEENVRLGLVEAYKAWLASKAITRLTAASLELEDAAKKVRDRIDDLEMIEFIPGTCRICASLGL